jgi:hypothetical protein
LQGELFDQTNSSPCFLGLCIEMIMILVDEGLRFFIYFFLPIQKMLVSTGKRKTGVTSYDPAAAPNETRKHDEYVVLMLLHIL